MVELTEPFLAKIAGWEAMKRARAYVNASQVLEAAWAPPLLTGLVQDGTASVRAGLRIASERNVENLCRCRPSQERGLICGHSIAVGLKVIQAQAAPSVTPEPVAGVRASSTPAPPVKRAGDGLALSLHVILPPKLDEALARGRIAVCVEAEFSGKRRPLNSLPRDQTYHISDQDNDVLEYMAGLAGGALPGMVMLDGVQLAGLLERLVQHPGVTLAKKTPVSVGGEAWTLKVRARLQGDGQIQLSLPDRLPPLAGGWAWSGAAFRPPPLPLAFLDVLRAGATLTRPDVPKFLLEEWPRLAAACDLDADFQLDQFEVQSVSPRMRLHLSGGLARLRARLEARYADLIVPLGPKAAERPLWTPDPAAVRRYWAGDPAAERAALNELVRAGFEAFEGSLELKGEEGVLAFFARVHPKLRRQWDVTLDERLEQSTRRNLERIEPRVQVSASGVQWFDLAVEFAVGQEKLPPAEVQRLLLGGQSHFRLANGKHALLDTEALDEFQEMLRDCEPDQGGGCYRLGQEQAGFVAATLQQQRWRVEAPDSWKERVAALSRESRPVCPPLGDLEGILRPYQKEGVAWLGFLRRQGFGGVLADEMGLGKTLQTLAHLDAVRSSANGGSERLPSLVICPTSLLANWAEEARRFVPSMKVLTLWGTDRAGQFEAIPGSDLVITSYALARRDAGQYGPFDTVVLDEAQHIKNRQTQNAQAVKAIRCRHRLVLTGTPMENSVLDLWSIFDFLMPGYLGSAPDFRDRYEIPITRHQNAAVQERLSRRVRPFILRRLKREVAPELPARIEQVCYCELNSQQQAVYRQVLETTRQEVHQAAGAQGLARSRMVMLNSLLRLRQICCDLRLLPMEHPAPPESSGKVALFEELIEEALDGGHRVLVFSQFVKMLGLLRDRLDQLGIGYSYLDGATSDRGEVVARFQRGNAPVFLISLKAGGVGLNLTGADTVIHFDPWWNPAVEAQATDRAHRLGQTRVVTSYKLISRGTVEEKILGLQARKRELLQSALGDEENFLANLGTEEMLELLAW